MEKQGLQSEEAVDQSSIADRPGHTKHSIVGKEAFPVAFLVLIHALQRPNNAAIDKTIDILSLGRGGGVLRSGYHKVMSV